jgi:hypothetical protein
MNSFLPNNMNTMHIQKLILVILPYIQNILDICRQFTILIFYEISSGFVGAF